MIEYKPQVILPRVENGSDYGTDRIVVVEFPNLGKRLIWYKGANHWTDRMSGYQYHAGHYEYNGHGTRKEYASVKSYSLRSNFDDESVPKLNNEWVRKMFVKMASLDPCVYRCLEAGVKYERGKTIVCHCKTSDQQLDDLATELKSFQI